MQTIKVFSENAAFQQIESYKHNRTKRQKAKRIFVEGRKPIELAVENGWIVDSFLYVKENLRSDWVKNLLKASKANFHYEITDKLMMKLSDKQDVSELIAIFEIKEESPSRILFKNRLVIILDRPSSPGNLGTMIRSCDAMNVDGVIVTGHAADIYDPQAIRSSMGALFSIPVVRLPSHSEVMGFIERIRIKDLQVIGTSAKAQSLIYETDFTHSTILFIGNETLGLSQGYKDICDRLVKIPISGVVSSLNVACAGTVFLYEVQRQRSL